MARPIVDRTNIDRIAAGLARRDAALARILADLGTPPLWKRPTGFATLVRIVLEQQVSLDSARATFLRLQAQLGGSVTAKRLVALDDQQLREIGFSRQKSRYCRLLGQRVVAREFSIRRLQGLDDAAVRQQITSLIGFGDWSADVYLLMALGRADILPTGDLALMVGLGEVTGTIVDGKDALLEYAEKWRPYRSVGTRMIWQAYLHRRGKEVRAE